MIMEIGKGTVFVSEDGDVLTFRGMDEADRVIVDIEGSFKTFSDQEDFQSFLEQNDFEQSDVQIDEPEDLDEPELNDEPDLDEPELDNEPEEDEKETKVGKFQDLFNQMISLGKTGNDKIDSAVAKLKKALSDELISMTSENFDEIYSQLKNDGYIK